VRRRGFLSLGDSTDPLLLHRTYIVEALKADDGLAFSRERLKELAMLDSGSWRRHRWWIGSLEDTDRGLEQQ
jgi:hypothetical protein